MRTGSVGTITFGCIHNFSLYSIHFFFGLICKEENKTFLRVKIACLESNQYSLKKKEDCFMKLSVLSSIQEFYATYY